MEQTNELLRRLRRIPAERRSEFLRSLHEATQEYRAPLSFRQEQLWVLDRLLPEQVAYTLAFAFHLSGPLALPALEAAVDELFARHTALRSVFGHERGIPFQRVVAARPVELALEEVSELEPEAAMSHIREIVRRESGKGFDFEHGPLVRLRLFRLTADEHVLLWLTHYLVFDEESAGIVCDELGELYSAALAGELRSAADMPSPYSDYAELERRSAETDATKELLGSTVEELEGVEPLELSPDKPRPASLDLSGETLVFELDAELAKGMHALADRLGVADEAVPLAAYAALLARIARTNDVVVGMPVRMRAPSGVERLVGNYGNLLPIRVGTSGNATFGELVRRANDALARARAREEIPFKLVLDAVQSPRNIATLPIVQAGFAWRPATSSSSPGALAVSVEKLPTDTTTFELFFELDDSSAPALRVEYATALFEPESVRRLATRFVRMLAAGVADPGSRCSCLPLLSADEHTQVLEEWNPLPTPRPGQLLHDVFSAQVARTPEAVALASAEGASTYAELEAASNRIAAHLRAMGAGPEERVGLFLPRGSRMVESMLAILKSGAAYVPLDGSLPPERVGLILADSGAKIVVTDAAVVDGVPAGPWRLVNLDRAADAIAAQTSESRQVALDPRNLAYVIYTSGSTGRPKGVLIEHASAAGFIRTVQDLFDLGPDDRFVQFASPAFDVSVFEIFGALLSGAELYVLDDEERHSLPALGQILRERAITVVDLPPALLELLDPERLPDLRVAFVGGEAFSGALTTRWAAGGRNFTNGYGPTETTVTVVAERCEGTWTSSPPIGRAMANHRAYVLDTSLGPLGVGLPGELAIAGAGLARGYLERPSATAERFRPDPFGAPGSRLYLTGDLVKWLPEGKLLFLGRVDRQVKIRGVRIELGEIEAALVAHPDVAQAVVEAVRDPRGETLLVAYVVGCDGTEPESDLLRELLTGKLPRYMVPDFFVPIANVPLTTSGKLDVRSLPPIDFTQCARAGDADDARTATEQRVAGEIFAPLVAAPQFGIRDNFFALGGTSLQAIRVIPRVQAVFGVELPVTEFFQDPTVAGVAAVVDRLLDEQGRFSDEDLLAALEDVERRTDEEVEELLRTQYAAH